MGSAHEAAASAAVARAELARIAAEHCGGELSGLERHAAESRPQPQREGGDGALVALDANTTAALTSGTPAARLHGGQHAGSRAVGSSTQVSTAQRTPSDGTRGGGAAAAAGSAKPRRLAPLPRAFGTKPAQRRSRPLGFDTAASLAKQRDKTARKKSTPKWV